MSSERSMAEAELPGALILRPVRTVRVLALPTLAWLPTRGKMSGQRKPNLDPERAIDRQLSRRPVALAKKDTRREKNTDETNWYC
jgi:hypothetical protein